MKRTKKFLSAFLAGLLLFGTTPAMNVSADVVAPETATAVTKHDTTVFLADMAVKKVYAPNGNGIGSYDVLYKKDGIEYTETFDKSLFTHSQPNQYDGKPAYIKFDISAHTGSTDVLLDSFVGFLYKKGSQTNSTANDGNAKFLVYADGTLVYSTDTVTPSNDLQNISVVIPKGTKELSLELDCVKSGAYGHSNDWCAWYAPRITPIVYLTDLDPTHSHTGSGDQTLSIGKLNVLYTKDGTLVNEEYDKSIFLHAQPNHTQTNPTLEKANIQYDVSGYTVYSDVLFETYAGIRYTNNGQVNDGTKGSVKFYVYADDTLIASIDETVTPNLDLQSISVMIPKGTGTLRLETDCVGTGAWDHASDWSAYYMPRMYPNLKMFVADLPIAAETCNYKEPVVGTNTIRYSATSTKEFEKSIFTHANAPADGVFASVSYNISDMTGAGDVIFSSAVGILDYNGKTNASNSGDVTKPKGEAHFNVYADDVLVAQAKNITPYLSLDNLKITATIPAGTKVLKLEIDHCNDNQWGHDTDWCLWGTPYIYGISLGKSISYADIVCEKQVFDVGDSAQLSVAGYLANGDKIDASDLAVTYSSDNTNVVTVDSKTGELSAVGTGVATVKAFVGYGKTVEAVILVAVGEKEGEIYRLSSPDNSREAVLLIHDGEVYYAVMGDAVHVPFSKLGMVANNVDLSCGLSFVSASDVTSINETYTVPARIKEIYENKANERVFTFTKDTLTVKVILRAYNDGAAFRYIISSADGSDIVITNESTKISVSPDTTVFAMPYTANYEGYYAKYALSEMTGAYCMPLIMKNADGTYTLVSDADINPQYSGTKVEKTAGGLGFVKTVAAGTKPTVSSPFVSPWRAFITGELSEIVESTMITDLSPAADSNIDWSFAKPGMASWTWGNGGQDSKSVHLKGIDQAAEMGWTYYTLDYGWHKPAGEADGNYYYPVTAGDHFEWIPEVVAYANEKGVKLIGWIHKKNADTDEERKAVLEDYKNIGMSGIKIDFFDSEAPETMQLYEDIFAECARLGLVVNTHGSSKPSGETRKWPNLLTREAVRGEEFSGRDNGMTPEQYTIIPFTRGVVGPADVTEQIYSRGKSTTTAASQIAISVIMMSGIHHIPTTVDVLRSSAVYDLYKSFPAVWDDTKLLYGEVGENIGMARRSGNDWYIGGITVEADKRSIPLDFLPDGKYLADIYTDDGSRTSHIHAAEIVDKNDSISVEMAYHGGYVIRLTTVEDETAPESCTIAEETVRLADGESHQLIYEIESGSATLDRVIFVSSNNNVATVNTNGLITSLGAGVATVSAVSPVDLSVYDSVTVYSDRVDGASKTFEVTVPEKIESGDICTIAFTAASDSYSIYDSEWNKVDAEFTQTANGSQINYTATFTPAKGDVFSVVTSDGAEVSYFTVNMAVTVYFDEVSQEYVTGESIDLPVLEDKEGAVFAGWKYDRHVYYGNGVLTVPTGVKEMRLTSVYAEDGKALPVYVDEVNGNNENSGFAYNKAVADWFKAFEILSSREGEKTVYIIGTHKPSTKVTPALNGHVTVEGITDGATIDFDGKGADFKSGLTFRNITIMSNARYGFLNTFGNKIVFGEGTVVANSEASNMLAIHSGLQNANGGKEIITVDSGKFEIYAGSYYNFDTAKDTAGVLYTVNGGDVTIKIQADGYTNNAGVHVGSRFSEDFIVIHNGGVLSINNNSSTARPISLEKNFLLINNYGTEASTNSISEIVAGGTYIVNSAKNGGHVEAVSGNVIKLCPDEGNIALVNGIHESGEYTLTESGTYTVEYVNNGDAMIGDTVYPTVEDAFANAKAGNTVKLIKTPQNDVTVPDGITFDIGNVNIGNIRITMSDNSFVTAKRSLSESLSGKNGELAAVNVTDGVYTYVTAAAVSDGTVTMSCGDFTLDAGTGTYDIALTRTVNGTAYTLDITSDKALDVNFRGNTLTVYGGNYDEITATASGTEIMLDGGAASALRFSHTSGTVSVKCGESEIPIYNCTLGGKVAFETQDQTFFTGWGDDGIAKFTTAEMYGIQIRTEGVQGLRFIAKLTGDYKESLDSYGIIVIPEDLMGDELNFDTPRVREVSSTQPDFKIFSETDTERMYTVCLIGITPEKYNKKYVVRAYIRYTVDGEQKVAFSDLLKGDIITTINGLCEQYPGEYDELYDTIMKDYSETFTSTGEFKALLSSYAESGTDKLDLDFSVETAISADGDDVASNGWKSTDYIATQNRKIVQYTLSAANGISSVAFYDADKNFLEGVTTSSPTAPYTTVIYDKTIPEKAEYVRFSCYVGSGTDGFAYSKASLCDNVGEMLNSYVSAKDSKGFAGKKIVCLGDGLTYGNYGTTKAGTEYPHEENYPYFLQKYTGASVEWYAKSGYTAANLAADYSDGVMYSEKVGKSVDLTDADYIIIMVGTNGGLYLIGDRGNYDSYLTLVQSIRSDVPNAQIILVTPPHATEDKTKVNYGYMPDVSSAYSGVYKIAEICGLPVFDAFRDSGICADTEEIMQPNGGLYFGGVGYASFAAFITNQLKLLVSEKNDSLSYDELVDQNDKEFLATISYPEYELCEGEYSTVGRWFKKEIGGNVHDVTLNSGSELYFLVSGASDVTVDFTVITSLATPYYAVSLDGGDFARYPITENVIHLPDKKQHAVRIVMDGMNENEGKWDNETGYAIKGISPNTGRIRAIRPTNEIVFYFGDSITEGINALGTAGDGASNSAINTYAHQSAKALRAIPYVIGYGGSGIVKEGSFNTMLNAIDNLSATRKTDDTVTPDRIVINHGYNDYSAATSEEFKTGLKATLDRLIEKYPDTPIYYVIPFSQRMAAEIRTVCANYDEILVIETADYDITYSADGIHLAPAGAKTAGERIARVIEKDKLATDEYKDYIYYRKPLQNTYTRLTKDKQLNIAYYGGSITQGYGASATANNWRMKTQKWFSDQFPDAQINEIYAAFGESGTFLGSYILDDFVLAKEPDLVFIEYAINDTYAGFDKTRAAKQFETIIREIKEAYPKCDIVTLISIDQGRAQYDWFYPTAQGHAEISEAYNIPLIFMGKALSDHISAEGSSWNSYFRDIVHPLDSGYQYYYNVIAEYLGNSLFATDLNAEYLPDDTLPEIVSSELLSGKRSIVYAPDIPLTNNSGWTYKANINTADPLLGSHGCIAADLTDTTSFTYTFTGNDFSIYTNLHSTSTKFNYTVTDENGKVEKTGTGNFASHNPTTIVEGLANGTHTVTVSPVKSTVDASITQMYIDMVLVRDENG